MERTENSTKQTQEKEGRRPIIAVDFDGTLCVSKWPEIGEPRFGVIAYCIAARATGSRLILWTNRTGKELEAAVEWCRGHHLEFDAVNENLQTVLHVAQCEDTGTAARFSRTCTSTTSISRSEWSTQPGCSLSRSRQQRGRRGNERQTVFNTSANRSVCQMWENRSCRDSSLHSDFDRRKG